MVTTARSTPLNVFLSYSDADREFARELASLLNDRGFSTWEDSKLLPGDNCARETGKALEKSNAVVVLFSPDWAKSSRLRKDIEYALGQPQYAGRLVGLVVRPTKDVPWIFEHLQLLLNANDPSSASRAVASFLSKKPEVARG